MNPKQTQDEKNMKAALRQAQKALELDEVPIGAVVVHKGRIVGRGYNTRETKNHPLGHAEIHAINQAARRLGRWRLTDCTLYVTLEPCPMCAGAIVNSRISRLVFGAKDPKAGAVESLFQLLSDRRLNHRVPHTSDVLGPDCSKMLRDFFRRLRK